MEQTRKYNILVTGGCGFIGWNFIRRLYENQDKIQFNTIINLDKLDYSAINCDKEPYYDDRYRFIQGNIKYNSASVFKEYNIDVVVNFAAQTHVDNSIKSSYSFVDNNIVGMHMLMEEARQYWNRKKIDGRFIQISTDETMGSVEDNYGNAFNEFTPYHPNNPYAATKAAAELLIKSYIHTYKFPGIITNCSNNYGKGQHKEKLIPKVVECYANDLPVPVYGDGKQSRDWIYVDDHCDGIIDTILKGQIGEHYLFGTNETVYNIDLVNEILSECYQYYPALINIEHITDRLGHDRTYRIDYSKAERELGWKPKTSLKEGLEKTVLWYINKYQNE